MMKPKRTVCQSVPGSESEVRRLSLCPRRGGAPPPRGDLKGGAGKEGVERSRYLPTIPPAPPHLCAPLFSLHLLLPSRARPAPASCLRLTLFKDVWCVRGVCLYRKTQERCDV